MNQELKAPDHPCMMITNRDFRLSSMSGFVVNFKADQPTRVPPMCYVEAVGIGAVVVEDQPEPEKVEEPKVDPSIAEAARLEQEAKITYVEKAIVALMDKEDNGPDFKADGYPMHKSVLDILAPQCSKPTATEVQEIFDDMRDDVTYAELFGT